ncbi:MAG: S8 family serine peptidase [Dehalococcoidia bacterium]
MSSTLGLLRLVGMAMSIVLLGVGWSARSHAQTGSSRLLVGMQPGVSDAALSRLLDAAGARLIDRVPELDLLVMEPSYGATSALLQRLRRHPEVRYVEADAPLAVTSTPRDPLYLDGAQWNLDMIRAPAAWAMLPPGGTSMVAVLDTGIDAAHPDLARQVLRMGCNAELRSGCSLAADGTPPRDNNGHGTHVAGIIGAATDNGVGVASVGGGRVSILAVRIAPNASLLVDGYRAIAAVVYAVQSGAKVINMSFGGPCGMRQTDPWRDAVSYAHDRDVLIVAAAGNDGDCAEGRYPASDPRVLSVAAVDRDRSIARFSTRGPWVSVAAPGVGIVSTDLGGYARKSGTSMAAPHVSALAALLYQVPGATKAKVMEWITATCSGAVAGARCGGVIDAYRAVHLAVAGLDPGAAR